MELFVTFSLRHFVTYFFPMNHCSRTYLRNLSFPSPHAQSLWCGWLLCFSCSLSAEAAQSLSKRPEAPRGHRLSQTTPTETVNNSVPLLPKPLKTPRDLPVRCVKMRTVWERLCVGRVDEKKPVSHEEGEGIKR